MIQTDMSIINWQDNTVAFHIAEQLTSCKEWDIFQQVCVAWKSAAKDKSIMKSLRGRCLKCPLLRFGGCDLHDLMPMNRLILLSSIPDLTKIKMFDLAKKHLGKAESEDRLVRNIDFNLKVSCLKFKRPEPIIEPRYLRLILHDGSIQAARAYANNLAEGMNVPMIEFNYTEIFGIYGYGGLIQKLFGSTFLVDFDKPGTILESLVEADCLDPVFFISIVGASRNQRYEATHVIINITDIHQNKCVELGAFWKLDLSRVTWIVHADDVIMGDRVLLDRSTVVH